MKKEKQMNYNNYKLFISENFELRLKWIFLLKKGINTTLICYKLKTKEFRKELVIKTEFKKFKIWEFEK